MFLRGWQRIKDEFELNLVCFKQFYSWQSRQALPNGTRKPYSKYFETALFVTEKSCPKRHH